MKKIKVTIWNEFRHEKEDERVKAIYPNGLHAKIKEMITADNDDFDVTLVDLDMPENGITDELLANTDVLIWWGHCHHNDVLDSSVDKIVREVQAGMGFIALHSSHMSKPFTRLMGTTGALRWREANEAQIVWNVCPAHPITQGIGDKFIIEQDETYGEYFDIPKVDDNIFITWSEGGEVFRSGCTFTRGYGKMFYFQPGHETYKVYYDPNVIRVIKNAIKWAVPTRERIYFGIPCVNPAKNDIAKTKE